MRSIYTNAYRFRGVLMAPLYLTLLFVYWGEFEHDAIVWPVGLALFALGVGIRLWAQLHLKYRLSQHKNLTTTGPYRYLRNPIYVANTLIVLSFTVVSELLWLLPVALVWCVVLYNVVVRREEAHLLEKYGAPYQAFLDEVPRWWPREPVKPSEAPTPGLLGQSIVAELHNFLMLAPFVGKEIYTRYWM